jgi:hypothetical protein
MLRRGNMTAVTNTTKSPPSSRKKGKAALQVTDDTRHAEAVNDDGDDDATRGEWLFKQNDLVLGPVTSIVLVDKIKKGELDADTPIARDGAAFRPMKLVRLFREAWQAAEEEKRFAAEERAYQAAVSRAKLLRVVVVLLLCVVPAAVAAGGARALMALRPWDDSAEWVARVPPVVDLPQKVADAAPAGTPAGTVAVATPTPDTPRAGDADATADDKTRKPKPGAAGNTSTSTTTSSSAPGQPATGTGPTTPDRVERPVEKPIEEPTGPVPDSLTNAQAVAPLKEIQGNLKSCFKAEIDSNPDMPGSVVLSYTVTEDGKAINVDLDARELRGRPVVACVQKAMSSVRWPRFSGERKNVSVPFKLGKPKPAAPKP